MKRATFKVLFYIKRTKSLKDGTVPIYARITVNRNRTEFGLQKSIEADQWDISKGCVRGYSKKASELNSYLDFVKSQLVIRKREMEELGQNITADNLKARYLGIAKDNRYILEIFQEHNEKCTALVNIDFAPGTIERYNTCYKHVESFIRQKYGRKDMPLSEIDPMFIDNFEYYLKVSRGCAHNTAVKYLKNFKKIIRIALKNGWMKSDPFVDIKFRIEEVDMHFLTESELNDLMNLELNFDRLQRVKDIYLFCCFTGLAFIDVKNLNSSHIEQIDGNYWIKKKRQKTNKLCRVPLVAPAIQILEKYKNHPVCLKSGFVLPVLSNTKMNAYLKEIADLCGIDKNLSTHTARHTFATTVTLLNQVSIEVVSKMLGHSSINMTKKYARVVDDLISKDMQKIYSKFASTTIH